MVPPSSPGVAAGTGAAQRAEGGVVIEGLDAQIMGDQAQ